MGGVMLERPHGGTVMGAGWSALVIGAILLFIGLTMPVFSDAGSPGYGGIGYRAPEVNGWKWPLTLLGGGLVNFGVLLVITGYIVRAIYFLPGRDVSTADLIGTAGELATADAVAATAPASVPESQVKTEPAEAPTREVRDSDVFLIRVVVGFVALVALVMTVVWFNERDARPASGSASAEAENIAESLEESADNLEAAADAATNELYGE